MKKKRHQVKTGRKSAAALRYQLEKEQAPRLVAKGMGKTAERILQTAREAGVPIHEDPDMAALLMTLDLGEIIPPEFYVTVAEILAFIYRMNKKAGPEY